jgi:hypothetical protein
MKKKTDKKNDWPSRTRVLTYALGMSDADLKWLVRQLKKVTKAA